MQLWVQDQGLGLAMHTADLLNPQASAYTATSKQEETENLQKKPNILKNQIVTHLASRSLCGAGDRLQWLPG